MPVSNGQLQFEVALRVLGHDVRRAIFEELWKATVDPGQNQKRGLTYEELREAVDLESSSRFSYHLDELWTHGRRVGWPDSDDPRKEAPVIGTPRAPLLYREGDRYLIQRTLGGRIFEIWTLTQPKHESIGPTRISRECHYCEERLHAIYQHHRLDLWCPNHNAMVNTHILPGDANDKSITDIINLAGLMKTRRHRTVLAGLCTACWGPLDRTVISHEHDDSPLVESLDPSLTFPHEVAEYAFSLPDHRWYEPFFIDSSCRNCRNYIRCGLGVLTCYRPAALHFFANHGFDVQTDPMIFRYVEHSGTVLSLDPIRVRVRLSVEDATKEFVVNETAQIVGESAGEPTLPARTRTSSWRE